MLNRVALLTILLVALLWLPPAVAGEHARVDGDALWAKECFILQGPVDLHPGKPPFPFNLGRMILPAYGIICVREVAWSTDRPVYRVLFMKMGTLDRRQNAPGWIDSRDLMRHGVVLSY